MPRRNIFKELEVARMQLITGSSSQYQVYKDSKEFVLVEAETASEAITKSGVNKPQKVVHIVHELTKLTGIDKLSKIENVVKETKQEEKNTEETNVIQEKPTGG